ncbi:TetR/AcrR family transcriptional regulator [Arthrobacter sp. GN70]|uniref:TetR/AcrR family transcriptional regulator n=1 Tax=Arthrobacter terricola TaxID=2547396 RepID=A0A4R5K6Y4_9MICC|nr:TetR/AcrR family transcriptional regulator [Arthrobacter sp. GN70]TDF89399.1 TetR/AcrR family transcriptional regulator [Arthrobacter terricola]
MNPSDCSFRAVAKILDAARSQIGLHGPDVGMEAIASAAGVAVGTLYRHFPTKVDLVAAVLSEYTEQMIAEAHRALARAQDEELTPLEALAGFLLEVIRVTAQNAAAKAAAPALGASINIDESEAAKALEKLIALGITTGEVRPDQQPSIT